ncbi:MAG: thioredoxin family protein [Bacteroidetes bacterium]|jgi:thioredoxin-like negative regulator of GroEL|nr:thioredoxin family protein [Bacteroidota bacterium]MBT7715405.1 thioredoxin family protein [Deltaproteobacteria bacterium]
MKTVSKYEDLSALIAVEDLVFVYLSQPACSVCQTLLPKVEDLMKDYPLVKSWYLNTADVPEAAGQLSVFTIPTVLFFVQGKEQFRLVRAFGLQEISEKIDRIYAHFA